MITILPSFKNRMFAGFLAGIVLLMSANTIAADTLISPDDPAINYYGRFDFSKPKAPRFNWSGSVIEFKITSSTTVAAEFTDGAGYFDIEIDGVIQSKPIYADSWNPKKYTIVNSLSSESHIIRIIRRNEPYWVIATFSGIYLSNGAKVTPLAKPIRKMEFCGDSYTAGYFIEDCADQQANTNTNKSWARLTSKAFKAQDIILAESGIGMLKSLGGKTPLPKKYLGTFDTTGGASTPMWDFSSWIPDIVTIFLGINDKSAGAADNEYSTAVHSFVSTIRSNYPNAYILFIAYTGCMDAATKTAVTAETTSLNHKGVYFLECKQQVKGCSWHPDITDAKAISDSVVNKIKQITGWDTTTVSVANQTVKQNTQNTAKIGTLTIDKRTILISAEKSAALTPIQIINTNGRVVFQLKLDLAGTYKLNSAEMAEGVYLVGSQKTGWSRVYIKR